MSRRDSSKARRSVEAGSEVGSQFGNQFLLVSSSSSSAKHIICFRVDKKTIAKLEDHSLFLEERKGLATCQCHNRSKQILSAQRVEWSLMDGLGGHVQ